MKGYSPEVLSIVTRLPAELCLAIFNYTLDAPFDIIPEGAEWSTHSYFDDGSDTDNYDHERCREFFFQNKFCPPHLVDAASAYYWSHNEFWISSRNGALGFVTELQRLTDLGDFLQISKPTVNHATRLVYRWPKQWR